MPQINIGSINNKLNYLENIKADMRNSLVNKGEIITSGTPFVNYVETIDRLTNTYGATVNSDSIWGEDNYAWVNNERVYGTLQENGPLSLNNLFYKMNVYKDFPQISIRNLTSEYDIKNIIVRRFAYS